MAIIVITVQRNDLIRWRRDEHIDNIQWTDISAHALPKDIIERADYIEFHDTDGTNKILKQRDYKYNIKPEE